MRVRDWMTPQPETIRLNALLQDAREMMGEGRLLGILTDRNLREHHGHLGDTRVTAAMTERPLTIGPDEPVDAAADVLLGQKIGRLPVVDGEGRLAGIITETDLLRGLLGRRPGEQDPRGWVDVQLTAPRRRSPRRLRSSRATGARCSGRGR